MNKIKDETISKCLLRLSDSPNSGIEELIRELDILK